MNNKGKWVSFTVLFLLLTVATFQVGVYAGSVYVVTPQSFVLEGQNIVWKESNTYYIKLFGSTAVVSSTNASYIIQLGINQGGTTFLRLAKYVLLVSLIINTNGTTLFGEGGGDLYFTDENKSKIIPFENRITTLQAIGFDAIQVGTTTLVLGCTINNIAIMGTTSNNGNPEFAYSNGCGIRVYRANTITLKNIEVYRKQYGIYLGPESFSQYSVVDIVTMQNILFAYCQYGLRATTWVCEVDINILKGYLNQYSLLRIDSGAKYGWHINDLWSYHDARSSTTSYDSPVYISSLYQTFSLENAFIQGEWNGTQVPLITLQITKEFGISGHVILNNVELYGTDDDIPAIEVLSGEGQLDINNLWAGTTSGSGPTGGRSTIGGPIIKYFNDINNNVKITVEGGFWNSSYAEPLWFYGYGGDYPCVNLTVQDIFNYTPVGSYLFYAYPVPGFSDLAGGIICNYANDLTLTPSASTDYTIYNVPIIIFVGNQTGGSVLLKNPQGTTIADLGITGFGPLYVPVGYIINFGGFSDAPTVTISGC